MDELVSQLKVMNDQFESLNSNLSLLTTIQEGLLIHLEGISNNLETIEVNTDRIASTLADT